MLSWFDLYLAATLWVKEPDVKTVLIYNGRNVWLLKYDSKD